MREERVMILGMLESGKITAEEAARLLEVIGRGSDEKEGCQNKFADNLEEKIGEFGKTMDTWTKDFADKMDGVIKEVEPKLRKVTQILVEKTTATIDEISKAIQESSKEEVDEQPCCGGQCEEEQDKEQ